MILSTVFTFFFMLANGFSTPSFSPRVRPSDKNWPSAAEWAQLKKEVGGRLSPVKDPLEACRKNSTSKSCFKVLSLIKNPFYIQDQAGATQTSGWFKAWDSKPSQYVVEAKNTQDVLATINFARTKNLRLVVKGGAHSYLGQSNAPDSLLLWTRKMNGINLHKNFMPEGSPDKKGVPAVSIETGAIWLEVYDAVVSRGGMYVQGGGCTTVGVGGFIQTGGFGSFSKGWGIAASHLLEAQIVTSEGNILTVNPYKNADLFWALKGGGGSFGVITKITLKTHPLPPYFGAVNMAVKSRSDKAFQKLLSQFFIFYKDSLLNPYWGENIRIKSDNTLEIAMTSHTLSQKQAEKIWGPFIEWIKKRAGDFEITANPHFVFVPAQKWWDYSYRSKYLPHSIVEDTRSNTPKGRFWWQGNDREVDVYLYGYDSAWLPEKLLRPNKLSSFISTLFQASRLNDIEIHFQKGLAGSPWATKELAKKTAINPIAIDSFGLLLAVSGQKKAYKGIKGYEPNAKDAKKGAEKVNKAMALVRTLIPDGGAYSSESDFFTPHWQKRAWGPNYPKLLSIKQKYDPMGLFVGRHYVGSEFWSSDGFTPRKAN